MSAELRLELSSTQQEILLKGLRYVRSSVALEMIDPTEEVEQNRRRQYAQIAELEGLLTGAARPAAAQV